MTTVGLILAAGQSTRFGPENKLTASLCGQPLISYAARALEGAGCDHLAVVTGNYQVAGYLPRYVHIVPEQKDAPQSHSLSVALRYAAKMGVTKTVVALGDMPLISSEHISKLIARCTNDLASATTDGRRVMVPACFPCSWFERLQAVSGDAGARGFLKSLPAEQYVEADSNHLLDIDYATDLKRAAEQLACF